MKRLIFLLSLTCALSARAGDPIEPSMPLRKALSDGASMTLLAPANKGSAAPFDQPTPTGQIQALQGWSLTTVENAENIFHMEILRDVISDPASLLPFPADKSTADALREFKEPYALSWKHGEETVYAVIAFDRAEIAYVTGTSTLAYGIGKPAYKRLTKTLLRTELESPPQPEKIATEEDARPILQKIAAAEKIHVYEGLPREGTPAFDDAVRNGSADRIGRFYFYLPHPDPGAGEQDAVALKKLLSDEDSFHPWSGEKEGEGFHPDYAIHWQDEQDFISVQICLGCGEAILLRGDVELRYDLGPGARDEFKKLLPTANRAVHDELEKIWTKRRAELEREIFADPERRRIKERGEDATPVSASDSWRDALRKGVTMEVHEGVPRMRSSWAHDDEMKRADVEKIADHGFYTPAVNATNAEALRAIIADPRSYEKFLGEKECGGFHPDFAVSWKSGKSVVHALFCYGCGEAIFTDGKSSLRYNLDSWTMRRLYPLFGTYVSKRPRPLVPDDPEAMWLPQKALREGAEITVFTGLPHEDQADFEKESKRGDVGKIGSEWFYQPGVPASNAADLRKILSSESLLESFAGKKDGAYFHAGYALSWMANGKKVELLVSLDYGGELIFHYDDQKFYYSLGLYAGDDLKKALEPNRGSK